LSKVTDKRPFCFVPPSYTRGEPTEAADIAKGFSRARMATIEELLETLVTVGQARQIDDGRFVA